jgi:P-type E1-E2 ATPase
MRQNILDWNCFLELFQAVRDLVVNAVLSFMQERRAAGVVETLRKRLQVNARVLRDASWQVFPARELVPGDIVRLRPGDIIPADMKLLTGALSVDQSALTGESKDVEKNPRDVLSSGSVVRRGEHRFRKPVVAPLIGR